MPFYNPTDILAPRAFAPTGEDGNILPGWIELTTPEEIEAAELEIEVLIAANQPPESPNVAQFLLDCVPAYMSLMGWLVGHAVTEEEKGRVSVIQIATGRLEPANLPAFIALWNTAFAGCDLDAAIPTAINAAAVANHIPIVMGVDFNLVANIAGDSL